MPKFWKSKEFNALRIEWNKKLEASDFKDAEKDINYTRFLKDPTAGNGGWLHHHLSANVFVREEKETYYRILSQKFQEEKNFEDEEDRLIMELTVDGKTITEISSIIKARLSDGRKRSKHNRDTIRYIRRRYENKWGIRCWKPEQMTSRKKRIP